MQDFINNNKCVIRVINSDNFCLLRAILIVKAFVDKERNASHLIRKNNRKLNERLYNLRKEISIPVGPIHISIIEEIQNYFQNEYQISVYDKVENGTEILYPSEEQIILNKTK